MSLSMWVLAIAPIATLALFFYFKDIHKEPPKKLIKAIFLGAIVIFPVGIAELVVENMGCTLSYSPLSRPSILTAFIYAFLGIALIEEGAKFFVFYRYFWDDEDLDEFYDALIYAVFVALGFAMVENVFYVYQHGAKVGMIRAVTAVPSHALDGVAMGIPIGLAKFVYPERRGFLIPLGLIAPIITHGVYDALIIIQTTLSVILAILTVIVGWLLVPKIIRYTQSQKFS